MNNCKINTKLGILFDIGSIQKLNDITLKE